MHDVVCPTLIGRDAQLDSLRQLLGRAREGHGRVALIVGEAGVGKSRLLRALSDEARDGGFFVLQGSCFEAERSIPYAPLVDLVRLFASATSTALVEHVLGSAANELVSLFPELQSLLPNATANATGDPEADRRRLFTTLAQALTTLARTQPVLLAFEDVHWSDDATLELVFHLARSQASHPVVIALTYRGEEAGPRLARLVTDLERARLVSDVPLDRLGRGDVGAMLQAIFGPRQELGADFTQTLHGLTEGNPFFVEETLKSLIMAGDLAHTGAGWRARPLERVRVPRTAVEAVRRRLASLSVPARSVASMAAIAGRRFDFDLLQMLTKLDERDLLALIKELIAAQLVVEESAERFAFRHALTREAIYAELLARERVALHREVGAALERQHENAVDGVVEALAYHAWESGDWERAARYAARAARHAVALSAPREALAQLDRAFTALERSGAQPDIDLHLARGRAAETLGEFQRANDDFVAALERARHAGDRHSEWVALYALGMLWAARDYSRAGEYRREALSVARALGEESLIARSLNRVGNWHVNLDEPRAGIPYHEEALAIVERLDDHRGISETVDLLAMAYHIGALQRQAASHYARSVELFMRADDRRGYANAIALLALCSPSYQSSATTPFLTPIAEEELRTLRSPRMTREIGWRAGEAFVRFILADTLMWRGEYDRAIPLAREALIVAREIEHREWSAGALRILGAISLDLLAPALACEQLEAAHSIAQRLGSHVWIRWTAAPLAVAYGRTGKSDRALEVLDGALRLAGSTPLSLDDAPVDARWLTLGERQLRVARAEVAIVRHEPASALAIADQLLASERELDRESTLGVPRLALVRAEALTALGRFDAAHAALDAARAGAIAQHARPTLWRIEAARGQLHRAQRQRAEARRAFDAAREIAHELAARVDDIDLRNTFLSELDAIAPSGPAPSAERAARDALGGLTRRERDVAELVAHGKANRAIARELGIGERTVESYVASALAKLDFTSRAQLAAWAVENGLARGASQ